MFYSEILAVHILSSDKVNHLWVALKAVVGCDLFFSCLNAVATPNKLLQPSIPLADTVRRRSRTPCQVSSTSNAPPGRWSLEDKQLRSREEGEGATEKQTSLKDSDKLFLELLEVSISS